MKRSDYLLLSLFCFCTYGIALIGDRPLTMHEAVLPECTREMQQRGDWLLPTSGGRPWLHRPPLPHWGLLILNLPIGPILETWQVRLEPLLAGIFVTLLSAWLAQRWYGRAIGLLTGLILATSFQFVRYTWLAEEDMMLCAVITAALACFAKLEVPGLGELEPDSRFSPFVWQSWTLLGFFGLLGLSNLAKGLIFGPLMILVPVCIYLLTTRSIRRIGRYVWVWGGLTAVIIGWLWPAWIYWKYPDVLEMWRYDYGGRLNGGYVAEPWWYYGSVLLWAMLPWTPCVFIGLYLTGKQWRLSAPARFLWCWAIGILLFFSMPDGKHHHYFIHTLPAWAMLAAMGLQKWWLWVGTITKYWANPWRIPAIAAPVLIITVWLLRSKLPEIPYALPILALGTPLLVFLGCVALVDRRAWRAGVLIFTLIGALFIGMHFIFGHYTDESLQDAAFLKEVPPVVPVDVPLVVNAELRSCLEVNRILFDLKGHVRAIHNLTFLLDEDHRDARIFLLTQAQDEEKLRSLGEVHIVKQSPHSRREANPGERLTLFDLTFASDLPRYSAHVYIEQQQIKMRKPGPYLGGKAPSEWHASRVGVPTSVETSIRPVGHRE